MGSSSPNYRLFWKEFRRTFHSTGALLPSGPALCEALASRVAPSNQPRRILEVGPGTGVVTDRILARMGPEDTLDLVELNARFVDLLRDKLRSDPQWQAVSDRVCIAHVPIEAHDPDEPYDVLVSGLPLNNFPGEVVQSILDRLRLLATHDATLSFFEYVAVRKVKALVCKPTERRRLAAVQHAVQNACAQWSDERQCVLANVPPAWVHHLRFTSANARG